MTASAILLDHFPTISKTLIKTKLPIITAVATIVCTGLSAQAADSEFARRQQMIGFLAAGQCIVNTGMATQETVDGWADQYVNEDPERKPAYQWATTSPNGKAAVQATVPFLTPDCGGVSISDEQFARVMMPFFK